jgi:hypothetical protein
MIKTKKRGKTVPRNLFLFKEKMMKKPYVPASSARTTEADQ